MKIRNGFVSNSSSSSYIIAFDRNIREEALIEMLNDRNYDYGDGTYVRACGIDNVMCFIKMWYTDLICLYKICFEIENQISFGNNVAWVNISHYDDEALDIINHNDCIEILGSVG